jgi:hypothetical protein
MRMSGFKELNIAAKLIDEKAPDTRLLVWVEQFDGAEQGGEDAAAIDVADQQTGGVLRVLPCACSRCRVA